MNNECVISQYNVAKLRRGRCFTNVLHHTSRRSFRLSGNDNTIVAARSCQMRTEDRQGRRNRGIIIMKMCISVQDLGLLTVIRI